MDFVVPFSVFFNSQEKLDNKEAFFLTAIYLLVVNLEYYTSVQ